ncbi:hypothetical protein DFJ74DRAFT_38944 [Hyaloraphidium curvatum]|nr:hypothetical protein DFJ74DRAFT_38944 [Hyaloraphidium curvatum]
MFFYAELGALKDVFGEGLGTYYRLCYYHIKEAFLRRAGKSKEGKRGMKADAAEEEDTIPDSVVPQGIMRFQARWAGTHESRPPAAVLPLTTRVATMATLYQRPPVPWAPGPMFGVPTVGIPLVPGPPLAGPGMWRPPHVGDASAQPERAPVSDSRSQSPENGPPDGKRKTACDRCRMRKRRCDLATPKCKSCSRTGSNCTYQGLWKRPSRAKKRLATNTGPATDASGTKDHAETERAPTAAVWNRRTSLDSAHGALEPELEALVATPRDCSPLESNLEAFLLDPIALNMEPTISVSEALPWMWPMGFPPQPSLATAETSHKDISSFIPASIARTPTSLPPLPAEAGIVFAIVDRFFVWSDDVLPTIHRGRFYEAWPPSPLLMSTILLVSPLFDPPSQELVASTCSKRMWNQSLFARVKATLPVTLNRAGLAGDFGADIASTFLLGVWAAFSGLGQLCQGFYGLTQHLVRRAGWQTSPISPAPTFRQVVAQRLGAEALVATLGPGDVSALRDIWIDLCQQHRIMNIFSIGEQTRRDWARALDSPPEPDAFDAAFRPAPPGLAEWEASFDAAFDPRALPETPLISDSIAWIDLPEGHPDRERALERMAFYVVAVRGTLPWLAGKFRAIVDTFLWACRSAGLHSPAQLPPAAPVPPTWLSRPAFQRLVALRDRADKALLDFRRSLPLEMREAWLSGSATEAISALLGPEARVLHNRQRHFQYAFNVSANIPGILFMRAELYTSIGTCLSRGLSTELAPGSLEVLADEFGAQAEPFASLLEDAILATRFHVDRLRIEPRLARSAGNGTPTVLRCAILHTAFCKRFRGAGTPPEILDQVAADAREALRVLEAFARRHGGFMSSAHALAKKLWEDGRPSEFELEAARLGVDLEPEDDSGNKGMARAAVRTDPVLASLLNAYGGRRNAPVV